MPGRKSKPEKTGYLALDPRPEVDKMVHTQESAEAFESIKSLGRREIAEGRGDSAISGFIKIFVEEVEKVSRVSTGSHYQPTQPETTHT